MLTFALFYKVAIYASSVCKSFGPKIWSCKIFDKFQVCLQSHVVLHLTLTKRVRGEEISNYIYILCARINCGIRIHNCGPLIIIFKWRLSIQVKSFSREAIPFKRQPLQNVRVGWKLSNLRQKILERLVKNFEQISYSFSTNKPFTWNQHHQNDNWKVDCNLCHEGLQLICRELLA